MKLCAVPHLNHKRCVKSKGLSRAGQGRFQGLQFAFTRTSTVHHSEKYVKARARKCFSHHNKTNKFYRVQGLNKTGRRRDPSRQGRSLTNAATDRGRKTASKTVNSLINSSSLSLRGERERGEGEGRGKCGFSDDWPRQMAAPCIRRRGREDARRKQDERERWKDDDDVKHGKHH